MGETQATTKYDVKLPFGVRVGFGFASIADSIILDFVATYFLFFLTTFVGINPAIAGTITLIAVLWDAITDPIIGNISDKVRHENGKYRRVMSFAMLSTLILTVLMFTKVNLSPTIAFIYYTVVAVFYYTSYTVFNIPYMALGSSLTTNDNEKTKLSGMRQAFGYIGMLFAGSVPGYLIAALEGAGIEGNLTYTISAALLGLIATFTIFITWRSTKGYEINFENKQAETSKKPLREILGVLFKLKPYIILLASALLFYMGFTVISGSIMFVITGALNESPAAAGTIFLFVVLTGIVYSFVLAKVAEKLEKKYVYIGCVVFSAISALTFNFIGLNSLTSYIVCIVLLSCGMSAYLVFVYNFLYDIIDIVNFKTKERNGGAVFAYFSFVVKLGKALAAQLIGIVLAFGGYVATEQVQTQQGVDTVTALATVVPAVLFLLSAALFAFYPVTTKKITKLRELSLKEGFVDTSEIETIL